MAGRSLVRPSDTLGGAHRHRPLCRRTIIIINITITVVVITIITTIVVPVLIDTTGKSLSVKKKKPVSRVHVVANKLPGSRPIGFWVLPGNPLDGVSLWRIVPVCHGQPAVPPTTINDLVRARFWLGREALVNDRYLPPDSARRKPGTRQSFPPSPGFLPRKQTRVTAILPCQTVRDMLLGVVAFHPEAHRLIFTRAKI